MFRAEASPQHDSRCAREVHVRLQRTQSSFLFRICRGFTLECGASDQPLQLVPKRFWLQGSGGYRKSSVRRSRSIQQVFDFVNFNNNRLCLYGPGWLCSFRRIRPVLLCVCVSASWWFILVL